MATKYANIRNTTTRGFISPKTLIGIIVAGIALVCPLLALWFLAYGQEDRPAYVADPSAAYLKPTSDQTLLSAAIDQHTWFLPLLIGTFLLGIGVSKFAFMKKDMNSFLYWSGLMAIAYPVMAALFLGIQRDIPNAEGSFDVWAQSRYGVEVAAGYPSDGATAETSSGELVTVREVTDRTGDQAYILVTSGSEELPVTQR